MGVIIPSSFKGKEKSIRSKKTIFQITSSLKRPF